ncbi:hypothetical protein QR680_003954 [Steinernema hermaphroditum]|uniref:Uncharacterized protein n=1 Tax=Steinernema hermaphroditum TaxID=289476 RepID=A0AA39HPF6_9BILA|nr:hypothetical protein QR680_003954 [Steinernema hermaphroditum]
MVFFRFTVDSDLEMLKERLSKPPATVLSGEIHRMTVSWSVTTLPALWMLKTTKAEIRMNSEPFSFSLALFRSHGVVEDEACLEEGLTYGL